MGIGLAFAMMVASSAGQPAVHVAGLMCEYQANPLGIDVRRPRLFWRMELTDPAQRGQRQTAYRVLVASSPERLAKDRGDLWDSGKVESNQCAHVHYAGKPLKSGMPVWWKVRVWDAAGKASAWSETATWSMGLLRPADWKGEWIGAPRKGPNPALFMVDWIWYPEGEPTVDAPVGKRWFRRTVDLPKDASVSSAELVVSADDAFAAYVNGEYVARSTRAGVEEWRSPAVVDLAGKLKPGPNVVAIEVENVGGASRNPAGLIANVRAALEGGKVVEVGTDSSWRCADAPADGWQALGFDDAGWVEAKVLGRNGAEPWGAVTPNPAALEPAPMLRKAFAARKGVRRATAYACGLGLYELYLNGRKVGDRVLEPDFTRYDKRVLYATFDVTQDVKAGKNALGVVLGNGFYNQAARDAWLFERAIWRDLPKARVQLCIEYEDGTQEVVASDGSWRLATGPTQKDAVRQGEWYDARLELPGWATAGFDDSKWAKASVVPAPAGALKAGGAPPIKVMQTIRPVKLSEPKPGVFIFDLGQNIAGWAQIRVQGPAGTTVKLRYAERLHPDGTLDQAGIANLVFDPWFQTDVYVLTLKIGTNPAQLLKGAGQEVWEPRFAFHGYQYVEVTGWPGTPTLDSLVGRVVHTAFDSAGSFECSNQLLNDIQRLTLWSYRGNYVGHPTDCPQREKNGWTGDAHLAAEQAMYNWFNPAAYTKWMEDFWDEQKPNGSLPGIVPTPGWGYAWGNGPAWDSAYVLIPWYLYLYEGDVSILERHFARMKRYVDYLEEGSKDLIVSIGLGDWVPAKTTTPEAVTSTGYFYVDTLVVAKAAAILGKPDLAKRYGDLAERIKTAFNREFVKPDGSVSVGSQTALSCALFQGLAQPEVAAATMAKLVQAVHAADDHIDTGILGAKYLFTTLSERGQHELAYKVATQTTPPSYGDWVKRGANTLWEDWPGANSLNHIMLGDISAWFYRQLAGIKVDEAKPGFKRIVLQPRPVGDLAWVKASCHSLYGRITSAWRIDGGAFVWHVVVPPNTTAVAHVPNADPAKVAEGGVPAAEAKGVKFLRAEGGAAVYELQPGRYEFKAAP